MVVVVYRSLLAAEPGFQVSHHQITSASSTTSAFLHLVLASTWQLKSLQEEVIAQQVKTQEVLAYHYYLQVLLASQVLDVRHCPPPLKLCLLRIITTNYAACISTLPPVVQLMSKRPFPINI
jgi:hypothetical protein